MGWTVIAWTTLVSQRGMADRKVTTGWVSLIIERVIGMYKERSSKTQACRWMSSDPEKLSGEEIQRKLWKVDWKKEWLQASSPVYFNKPHGNRAGRICLQNMSAMNIASKPLSITFGMHSFILSPCLWSLNTTHIPSLVNKHSLLFETGTLQCTNLHWDIIRKKCYPNGKS